MLIETEIVIPTQVFAKELLYYANYPTLHKADLDKAVKACRKNNPPPPGHAVDPVAFWNDLILATPRCRKFVEKQRINNLEELIRRLYAFNTKLEMQGLLEHQEQMYGDANNYEF